MADSIKELIVKDLVSTLEGITTGNGFDLTIRAVFRVKIPELEIREFPSILIIEEDEDKEIEPIGSWKATMRLTIRCYIEERGELMESINQILANVEKALLTLPDRAGNAIDTRLVANRPFAVSNTEPIGGINVLIDVVYRHAFADPFTKTC